MRAPSCRRTYHNRVDKRGPIIAFLKQGQNKGHNGGTQQDQDQLVFELFQDQLPERRGGFFGEGCNGLAGFILFMYMNFALLHL